MNRGSVLSIGFLFESLYLVAIDSFPIESEFITPE